jgi:glycosyltransferase involved in cell wall biosynthesis
MAGLKVLFISHNHPAVRPGGAEAYAFELYEAMRATDEFDPIFLARTGPPVSNVSRYHEGTLFTSVDGDPGQYFVYTDVADYDWFYGRSPNKASLTRYYADFLEAHRPDVVHFQHSLFMGYDMLRVTRNVLGDVPIVYTLHEYLPICHRNGQMVRTVSEDTCDKESPRRCHECFPSISPQSFFMRKRFITSHFELVDHFLAPSRFLRDRYVDWGIPAEKISFEEYGRLPARTAATRPERRARDRFAFFGQLSFFKGVNVLLQAMEVLGEGFGGHLFVHGANLDLQPQDFQDEFNSLLERSRETVTLVGRYDTEDVPGLMANVDWVIVPSIWWENSPLVIQEAFAHGKPVICSDVGGMAEKVDHGTNGLHFRRGDAHDLAEVMRTAASDRRLYEKLASGVPAVYGMDEHISSLSSLYTSLLEVRRRGNGSPLPGAAREAIANA